MSEPASSRCPIPRFDISAEGLEEQAKDLISHMEQATARLISACIDNTSINFETIIVPLAHIDNKTKARVQDIALFQAISPSLDVRKAASRAIYLVDRAYLNIFQNEKLFTLVSRVRESNSNTHSRSEEDVRLLSKFHWNFIENGMHLTGPSRDRFLWISHRLIELRVKFMETLGFDPGCLWKSKQQLAGVSLNKLSTGAGEHDREGLYRIPLTRPITNLILAECRVPDTRREVYLRSSCRYQANVETFREIIVLRDEAARLLGFPSFAAQKLTQQMLGSPGHVNDFLEHLQNALKPLAEKEIAKLHELTDTDGPIHLWDFDFYHTRILKEQNHVDHEYISQWFPARVTVQRMLGLYGELFGLRFEKVEISDRSHTWHPDVDLFSVWEDQESALIGYLYTDIFPRAGKYSHAANFNIYPSFLDTNGKQTPVVTALVCNVSQSEPALLRHAEVVSIFHELGHGIHDLVGKSKYAMFHGHRTVADFTEAPSQLLEYWCWTPECLRQLSCHYSYVSPELYSHWLGGRDERNATQPPMELPLVLAQNLGATKQLNQGILTLRQVAFSKFDMQIHNPDSHHAIERMHIPKVYNSLLETTTGLSGPGNVYDWGHGHATTSHFVWGQEASYYSYLYTRTLAADIWSSCFKDSPMSRQAAIKYRQQVLNHGGSKNEHKAVQEYLGRAPTSDAYLQDLGCKVLTTSA
ncbi:thimet oligopeptidase [Aspergillus pseudotamarii]|uniref:Thimet oligopeptidase n=1 Tax=Aspergillus pseudotamarii TaxID=132259 RepID=A0A5N6SXJ3_ASPPS|nr:thimet oligopeptidase [Aspergillus pseudotamarii]KAE8138519.1 thimet oligopeptidase [Aspergillus pseudotamarii]